MNVAPFLYTFNRFFLNIASLKAIMIEPRLNVDDLSRVN